MAEQIAEVENPGHSNALVRTVMGVLLAALAAAGIWLGGWWLALLVGLAVYFMVGEYCHIVSLKGYKTENCLLYAASLAMVAGALFTDTLSVAFFQRSLAVLLIAFLFMAASTVFFLRERASAVVDSAATLFGIVYCGFLPAVFVSVRNLPVHGLRLVTLMVIVCIATDVGAYVFGKTLGHRKLCPLVSPGKTWAGFWGGLLSAAVWGLAVEGMFCGFGSQWCNFQGHTSLLLYTLALVVASLFAQLGDLFESSLKRDVNLKDSSQLIKGHGGALDRLDSYLFVALFVCLVAFYLL